MFFKKLNQENERLRWKVQALEDQNQELKGDFEKAIKVLRRQLLALKKGEFVGEKAILEGLPYEKLTGKEAQEWAKKNPQTLFLDVRTQTEFNNGYIPGATHIPIDQLGYRIEELSGQKTLPVIAYCASGPRSELACELLTDHNFQKVFKMEGGIGTYPGELERPKGTPSADSPLPNRQRTADEEAIYQKARKLIIEEINPAVASHGGVIEVLDVMNKDIFVRMGGGCQGCGMASATLKEGVENSLRSIIPEMGTLYDTTDHASGKNPYYQSH